VTFGGRYWRMLKLRNKAVTRLSAVTMFRRGEIRMLYRDDYRRSHIRVRNPEKNSEYTERLLDSETREALDAYLEARKRTKHQALFITGKGKHARRISLSGLTYLIK